MAAKRLLSVDFEVFGRVQGVFFRKYTRLKAKELNLVGWVKNTKRNTVIGQMQGEPSGIDVMKEWLKTKGSPSSRIERCVFKNEMNITSLGFTAFEIRK
ncbi:acylphosphatase-1-like [Exaiptasia diaphana]|uniref:acylphosphatase n=1 Tax=Exaiptasia diaphana TaxID=2652724 RepID=A0A913XZ37_EXADI|nr:acylphosphatase-1-like [Exaiptasia diaphana]XP_020912032.1 acylphosphatase-1-like [Exaiptasia diaphana]